MKLTCWSAVGGLFEEVFELVEAGEELTLQTFHLFLVSRFTLKLSAKQRNTTPKSACYSRALAEYLAK